jgi:hypothetical protein
MNSFSSNPIGMSRKVVVLLLGLIFATVGSRAFIMGAGNYLNQSAENSALAGAIDFSERKPLFPDTQAGKFRLYTYTPLHAWLVGTLLKPLPIHSLIKKVYVIRLTSFLFLFAIYTLLWNFHIQPRKIPRLCFLFAIALSLSEIGNYVLTGRNDFLALFFEILGSVLFVTWIQSKQGWLLSAFAATCTLSFLTRQNMIGMILAGCIYLLARLKFKEFILLILSYSLLLGSSLFAIFRSQPHFLEHSFKSHAVFWRPFYWTEFSTLSFLICHAFFLFLVFKNITRKHTSESINFLKLAFFTSALVPCIQIYHPGAWLNYFFESILIGIVFCSEELLQVDKLPPKSNYRRFISFCFVLVPLVISTIALLKARKQASSYAFYDFSRGAETARKLAPQGGITLGPLAQGLGVYLRDWEMIGPEILNGTHYGETNYLRFQWVYDKLARLKETQSPPALLYVEPQCGKTPTADSLISDPHLKPIMGHYRLEKVIYSWLCLYSAPKNS